MPHELTLYDLVAPCLAVHEAALIDGTPEMKRLAALLLHLLGREIADRSYPLAVLDDA